MTDFEVQKVRDRRRLRAFIGERGWSFKYLKPLWVRGTDTC